MSMSDVEKGPVGVAVRVERHGAVAVVLINNPPVNAIGDGVLRDLDAALDWAGSADGLRCLVVSGAGPRAFSAGSDVKEFQGYLGAGNFVSDKLARENAVFARLADHRLPTVAAIEHMALGGGLELAVCCDLVVSSRTARLALPEIGIGGFPGSGGIVRIPRRIGFARAARMMFLGDFVTAERALEWGLVDELAEPGEALAAAIGIAERLAAAPERAIQACKAALTAARRHGEEASLAASLECSGIVAASEDFREGVAAFVAKRPPCFGGAGGP